MQEAATRAFNTAEFLSENGGDPLNTDAITREDRRQAHAVFMENPEAKVEPFTTGKALVLKAMLDSYDIEVVRGAVQLRNYVKLRLLELTNSTKETVQLKALELLGKMSDVQAFAEKVEVNITHQTTAELANELSDKLSRYMDDIIDVTPENAPQAALESAPAPEAIDIDAELG